MANLSDNKKSIIRRIPRKLDRVLNDLQKKNKMKFYEAGNLAADFLLERKTGKKVIEKIRREIEF